MKISSVLLLFVLLVPCIQKADTPAAPTQQAQPERRAVEFETECFRIYSYDALSASYVTALAEYLEKWFVRELRWTAPHGDRRVRVELIPAADAIGPDAYRINDSAGQISLYVRWAHDTDWDVLAYSLSHALLARAFQAQGAPAPVGAVPRWLIAACAGELASRDTAILDEWTRRALETAPMPLAALDAGPPAGAVTRPESAEFRRQAFWFFRHLRRECAGMRHAPTAPIVALARGQKLDAVLETLFRDTWRDADQRALWWPAGYTQLIHERAMPAFSMQTSREKLADATDFVFAPTGADQRFSPLEIIGLREQFPVVRTVVGQRLHQFRFDILRVNPVWHNAWRAYGVFLEKFSDANESTLRKLWEEAQREIEQAGALEEEIKRTLGKIGGDKKAVSASEKPR
ncbi:MAG: hypothetical protein LBV28_02500 [Puniceicoccales bacterium]|jgi:hypothetical protein|nr:hypothetical protein [Puniceicoccales bacterium]